MIQLVSPCGHIKLLVAYFLIWVKKILQKIIEEKAEVLPYIVVMFLYGWEDKFCRAISKGGETTAHRAVCTRSLDTSSRKKKF